jgi:hypothetical protein
MAECSDDALLALRGLASELDAQAPPGLSSGIAIRKLTGGSLRIVVQTR